MFRSFLLFVFIFRLEGRTIRSLSLLIFNFRKSYFGPFLIWSIKFFSEFKEEHNIAGGGGGGGGILKALLTAQFMFELFSSYINLYASFQVDIQIYEVKMGHSQ